MKTRHLLLILGFFLNTSWADFTNTSIQPHPLYPADRPFILEIKGDWSSDCHPGEQKPVIKSFDQNLVVIEFEIITVHVTCNEVITPFRVLVDMNEPVRADISFAEELDVQVDFDGAMLMQTVRLVCETGTECESLTEDHSKPWSGLFSASDLPNQGLLLARQNTGMGIFPLSYDDNGASEWLITGGHLTQDSFFGPVLRWSNGDCFGCEAEGAQPLQTTIGYLSVLVDRPDVLQVKFNNGLFKEYRKTVYGYANFRVGPDGGQTLVDIEGRWGISENRGTNPPLGDLTEFLPGAFDLVLENIVTANSSIQQDGQVSYQLVTPTGTVLGQLVCKGQTRIDDDANVCEFIDPTDAAEPLFLFYQQGPSSLSIEYGRSVVAIGVAPGGQAIRLD